jgi:hypothetical protein
LVRSYPSMKRVILERFAAWIYSRHDDCTRWSERCTTHAFNFDESVFTLQVSWNPEGLSIYFSPLDSWAFVGLTITSGNLQFIKTLPWQCWECEATFSLEHRFTLQHYCTVVHFQFIELYLLMVQNDQRPWFYRDIWIFPTQSSISQRLFEELQKNPLSRDVPQTDKGSCCRNKRIGANQRRVFTPSLQTEEEQSDDADDEMLRFIQMIDEVICAHWYGLGNDKLIWRNAVWWYMIAVINERISSFFNVVRIAETEYYDRVTEKRWKFPMMYGVFWRQNGRECTVGWFWKR